jgi:isoleucyl-tRNA synthetase
MPNGEKQNSLRKIELYNKVSASLDFVAREKEVLKFWETEKIFEKSMEERPGEPSYVFYDGPPTANGKPHIGHMLTRAIKDLIPRYQTMKGNFVPRKAGWDTHGLPVELEVEQLLGLDGKEQIEEYGIAPFIEKCKESVWKYKGMWEDFSADVGFWADMEHPYVTYHNSFIESEWWALKTIWEKDLLYKGFKIVPYCPRCGTPLSTHEVAQGYKDVKERSAIVRFKAKGEDAYILAWTTTPWTLPSNVALCVNPKETYVKVKSGDFTYYLAEALAEKVLGEYETLETYKGTDLEGKEYEPLWAFVTPKEKAWYITCDEYVTLTDGTGVVHIAPAFGEDDAKVGRKYALPFVQLVDAAGKMTAETKWDGIFCKEADKLILKDLEAAGLLFDAPVFEHSYPHCWRCGTPLIYYARDSWFIRMTAVRDDLVRNNETVNWIPPSIGTGRFGDWLKNVQDWGISRNRYWGTPLNIWECDCGHKHAIGSIAELCEMAVTPCSPDIELHRPYIDEVLIKCEKCGGSMKRVPEVIDCWFDSGSMPFAQHHYPFENKELFDSQFPAAFISEAVDQTRGWFYSLMAISTLIFNVSPFENVIVMGHVLDKDGQKMSKTKGNAVDPFDALKTFGADAIRWYFYTNSAPWVPSKWIEEYVREGQRKFMGTLWNTYAFYVLYAEIDGFNPYEYSLETENLALIDRWLLSKMNSMIKTVDEHMAAYRVPEACAALEVFTDELSNWYVRRSRERFWASGMEQDKINAYITLHTAIVNTAKCAAPMIPFLTEQIYQNLVRGLDKTAPESIHLCRFPEVDEAAIDSELEAQMETVLRVVTLGRACRNGSAVKNRQPLSEMYVNSEKTLNADSAVIVREELNVKKITFTDDTKGYISYSFKPQLKTVGPKFGKQLGEIKTALAEIDGSAAKAELDETGVLLLKLPSGEVRLYAEDLLIDLKQKDGYFASVDGSTTVVLSLALTPELIEEGFVNEITSKIQTMRKKADFVVTDHITVFIADNEKIADIVRKNETQIGKDVLADKFVYGEMFGETADWDLNGEKVTLGVEKMPEGNSL